MSEYPDLIAVFDNGNRYTVRVLIDGEWWPTLDRLGQDATWTSACQALDHISHAYNEYLCHYGERLPWNMNGIPIIEVS